MAVSRNPNAPAPLMAPMPVNCACPPDDQPLVSGALETQYPDAELV